MKKRKLHFKVVSTERPLWDNLYLGDAKVKLRGGDMRLTKLLTHTISDSERARDIITRAVRRYAKKNPNWWEAFKLSTDMQLPDPPRP